MLPTKLQSNLQTMTFSEVDIREKTREQQIPQENMRDKKGGQYFSGGLYHSRIFSRVSTPETIMPLWLKKLV
jgi:hypothetical protein